MNRLVVVTAAAILAVLVVCVHLSRRPRAARFDAVVVTSWLYFLLFALVPLSFQLLDLEVLHETGWRWILAMPFTDDAYVYASVIAVLAYPVLLAGAWCGNSVLASLTRRGLTIMRVVDERTPDRNLMVAGCLLLAIGVVSLAWYTSSIGGIGPLLLQGLLFRGLEPPVVSTVAFLKNVAYASLGASFCFFAVRSRLLFWGSFVVSLAALFHGAGRLPLVAYVATFPLAAMVEQGRWRRGVIVVLGALAVGGVLFGKQLFLVGFASERLASRWEAVGESAPRAMKDVVAEFSFPYVTLANATQVVPSTSPYRFFEDLPLAGLYLVPQRLLGVSHPPMLSMVNTHLVSDGESGTIPVDLLSFGYFSAGLVGVVLVTFLFGAMLPVCERLFVGRKGTVFRLAVTVFLAFKVMYGDPALAVQTGFYLLMTGFILLLIRFVANAAPPLPDDLATRGVMG